MAGDSSDDSDNESFTFYRDRAEWKDVTPVPQDDGPSPVVCIAYSEKFSDVYDYFRAIFRTGEKSERALQLTVDAAKLNPANYTVWHYRRILLKELQKDLRDELQFVTKVIKQHPKNYQVCRLALAAEKAFKATLVTYTKHGIFSGKLSYHRQQIVSWLNDPSAELAFTASILDEDAKNYHAWQHRQWAVKAYNLWDGELEYTVKLLSEDVRNNSAWNHRYFVVSHTTSFDDATVSQEIAFATALIRKAPNNESPWNYLRGVTSDVGLLKYASVAEFCNELYGTGVRSTHLLSTIIDLCREKLDSAGASSGCTDSETLERALMLCLELATTTDTIRAEYWNYEGRAIAAKYAQVPNA